LLINREAVGPFEVLEGGGRKGMDQYLARIMGGSGGRSTDKFWKGDADAGVRRLCDELGWRDDLENLIKEGHRSLKKKWESIAKEIAAGHAEETSIPAHRPAAEDSDQASEGSRKGDEEDEEDEEDVEVGSKPKISPGRVADEQSSASDPNVDTKDSGSLEDTLADVQKAIERDLRGGVIERAFCTSHDPKLYFAIRLAVFHP
jgi:hypothetical protein